MERKSHVYGTDIYECLQFAADSNKIPVNLNVASLGDCWALAELHALF